RSRWRALTIQHGHDVLEHLLADLLRGFQGMTATVRGGQHIDTAQQATTDRWLVLEHVKPSAGNPSSVQGAQEVVLSYSAAARNVDQIRSRLHMRQKLGIHDARRRRSEAEAETDKVSFTEELPQGTPVRLTGSAPL